MELPYQKGLMAHDLFCVADWAEQVFSRAAGAPIVAGNQVRLLRDGAENYPAWLESMKAAEKWIHFESYIIHDDDAGKEFGALLAAKAREGVRVRVVYDWLGAVGKTSRRFWQKLRDAGAEVRCFNPPRFDSPLGWISRDHRKMIGIDGKTAFVTGLCVGRMWARKGNKSFDPWRDTGIRVTGPAVADIEAAFAQIWAVTGKALSPDEVPDKGSIPCEGNVALRVVASAPNTGGLYRLDQQIAALARKSLWLTDAYYVGVAPYVQALKAAAMDGVDVRLLVPGATDIPVLRTVSRAGYKPLLEAGVRVFEWNGSMIHAKTAVADSYWARVGSTNLNLASWIGNYELDVVVEDEGFARKMEEMYLGDIKNATEIVLGARHRMRPVDRNHRRPAYPVGSGRGSVGRVGVGAIRIGNALGAAIANRRVLGPAEARVTSLGGIALVVLACLAVFFPRWVTIPIAIISGWFGLTLLIKAWRLHRMRLREIEKNARENGRENIS
ncbi:phospholipase D-like domain-containing protein [Syntrophorhabdus aromaticivorans]|uniref:Cardiolipin synthase B n=1 Tax=Syntrophorhabdus aromaticivorans TaxID=328301 RepID=A0A351TZI3_9BACT|nr:phospholipase D-like domain-containing protein [Syntrophorhabdus aromaticivorans]NLW35467.1 cardiolipin synthase B [Syntrophorhabdus aromaticivorans]HBA53114.1 cardiolipin synthase B [Syntrophorhabdus aromaticivorans]